MTSRRTFLATMAAALTLPSQSWAEAGRPAFLASAGTPGGNSLFGLDARGRDIFRIALPGRGHAAAAHPTRAEAVCFARPPGRFALAIDCARGRVLHRWTSPPGRSFSGHGCFLAGGDLLATAETDTRTGHGVVGLWDRSEGYRRLGEFYSYGFGLHEVRRLDDDTLVVANSGLKPDELTGDLSHAQLHKHGGHSTGMRPSIAYLSARGELLDWVEMTGYWHRSAVFHTATRADGMAAFTMQWQGQEWRHTAVPLLGLHRIYTPDAQVAEIPAPESAALLGEAGSVAFLGDGQHVAIAAPRGGQLCLFDPGGGFVAAHAIPHIRGLASSPKGVLITDARGGIWQASATRCQQLRKTARRWDSHVIAL